jgi:hypothetical protein
LAYKVWRLSVEGATYLIQMDHKLFTGDIHVRLDGKTIFRGQRDIAYVTRHKFRLPNWWSGHVEIRSIGVDCYYKLWLEGRVVDPEQDKDSLLRGSSRPSDDLLHPALPMQADEKAELLRVPHAEEP